MISINDINTFSQHFDRFNAFVGNTMNSRIENDCIIINNQYAIDVDYNSEYHFAIMKINYLPGDYMNPSDEEYDMIGESKSIIPCIQFITKEILNDKIIQYIEALSENVI